MACLLFNGVGHFLTHTTPWKIHFSDFGFHSLARLPGLAEIARYFNENELIEGAATRNELPAEMHEIGHVHRIFDPLKLEGHSTDAPFKTTPFDAAKVLSVV